MKINQTSLSFGGEAPKRGPKGIYNLVCVICGERYTSKCRFSTTCGQYCRNVKGYQTRKEKFGKDIAFAKNFLHSVKVLAELVSNGRLEIHADALFVKNFCFLKEIPTTRVDGEDVKFYGEYGLVKINSEKFKIIQKK